jgi:hypothetical protein
VDGRAGDADAAGQLEVGGARLAGKLADQLDVELVDLGAAQVASSITRRNA